MTDAPDSEDAVVAEDAVAAEAAPKESEGHRRGSVVRFVRWLGVAVLLFLGVLLFRDQVLTGYRISTGSMEPILHGHEKTGDQVVVYKKHYLVRSPKRWQIVAFRKRGENGALKRYVKRVCGLPGEYFEIVDGDVFANGRIQRKPHRVLESMLIPVYQGGLEQSEFVESWDDGDVDGHGWHRQDGSIVIPPGQTAAIRYRREIRDSYVDVKGTWRDGVNYAGDLVLDVEVTPTSPEGAVYLRLGREGDSFVARFPVGDGTVWLESPEMPEGIAVEPATSLEAGTRYRLRLEHVDRRVRIGLNGKMLHTFNYKLPRDAAAGAARNRAEFGVTGCGARFHDVVLRRDVYYTPEGLLGVRGPVRIPDAEGKARRYFLLGDNSAKSKDSRVWGDGDIFEATVPFSDIIGKPIAVVWPPSRAKLLP